MPGAVVLGPVRVINPPVLVGLGNVRVGRFHHPVLLVVVVIAVGIFPQIGRQRKLRLEWLRLHRRREHTFAVVLGRFGVAGAAVLLIVDGNNRPLGTLPEDAVLLGGFKKRGEERQSSLQSNILQ